MDRSLIKYSKFLSLVLRHRPEAIGLVLDKNGWVAVDELLAAASRSGNDLTLELLLRVVKENDKQRFSFNEDKSQIRANQGHSIEIDLQLEARKPPEELFHGTVYRFISSIQSKGLLKRKRQYVHLSIDIETAMKVGKRRGEPVVLRIAAWKMHEAGFEFFVSKNGVWLTDHVPPAFISFSSNPFT